MSESERGGRRWILEEVQGSYDAYKDCGVGKGRAKDYFEGSQLLLQVRTAEVYIKERKIGKLLCQKGRKVCQKSWPSFMWSNNIPVPKDYNQPQLLTFQRWRKPVAIFKSCKVIYITPIEA